MRGLRLSNPREERGAVLILMVVFSLVMVGMAALVVDVGSVLDEKRQLQNGADAGALAIAQSCAIGPTCDTTLAGPLANSNSRDNDSAAAPTFDWANKTVLVRTTTRTGGTSILPYSFGQILSGVSGKQVEAQSTARWAFAGRATALPLTISPCDKGQLKVGTQWTINLGIGFGACQGRDAPGAFGWLLRPCQSSMSAGDLVKVDTGASGANCLTTATIGTVVILPVFLTTNGLSGNNTEYRILGFAALRLTGWKFPGDPSPSTPVGCSQPCIAGTFVNYVTTDQVGGGGDFGIFRVFLSQ
jgi:Flp pilus assembly protein TadG